MKDIYLKRFQEILWIRISLRCVCSLQVLVRPEKSFYWVYEEMNIYLFLTIRES